MTENRPGNTEGPVRLLIADIGNSAIHLGILGADGSIESRYVCRHDRTAVGPAEDTIREWVSAQGTVEVCVVGSVVPALVAPVQKLFAGCCGATAEVLDRAMPLPFASRYAAGQAGIDRLANVAGAIRLGLAPCVVIDAGTAINVEMVSADGEFLGGVIFPGPALAVDALDRNAALLPRAEIEDGYAPDVRGGNTADAIISGALLGCAGAIDRYASDALRTLGPNARAIMTGGLAQRMTGLCRTEFHIDKDLTLLGMAELWKHSSGKPHGNL